MSEDLIELKRRLDFWESTHRYMMAHEELFKHKFVKARERAEIAVPYLKSEIDRLEAGSSGVAEGIGKKNDSLRNKKT